MRRAGSDVNSTPAEPPKDAATDKDKDKDKPSGNEPDADALRQEYFPARRAAQVAGVNAVASALYSTRVQIRFGLDALLRRAQRRILVSMANVFEDTAGAIWRRRRRVRRGYVAWYRRSTSRRAARMMTCSPRAPRRRSSSRARPARARRRKTPAISRNSGKPVARLRSASIALRSRRAPDAGGTAAPAKGAAMPGRVLATVSCCARTARCYAKAGDAKADAKGSQGRSRQAGRRRSAREVLSPSW